MEVCNSSDRNFFRIPFHHINEWFLFPIRIRRIKKALPTSVCSPETALVSFGAEWNSKASNGRASEKGSF